MKLNWTAFLKASHTPAARTMLMVGGDVPSETRRRIEQMEDGESKEVRLAMCDELRQAHADHRYEPESHDHREWDSIGNGAFRRREHL